MSIDREANMNRCNIDFFAVSNCRMTASARGHFSFKHLIFPWLTFLAVPGLVAAADLAVTSGHVLTPSPTAPLAAVYDVTTNEYSRVSFTASDGVESIEKSFLAFRQVHSLPLFGFKPGREYDVAVTLTDIEGNTLELGILSFTTDPLPADFPPLEVPVSDPDNMEPGYTLLTVRSLAPGAEVYAMILDGVGEVVWYQNLNAEDLRQLPNGNLFYLTPTGGIAEANLLGDVVRCWHPAGSPDEPTVPDCIEVDSTDDHPVFFHNESFPTDHGTVLTLDRMDRLVQGYPSSDTDPDAPTADTVVIDEPIVEFDMETGEILHYYSLVDMLDPRRIGFNSVAPQPPCHASNPGCKADWVHDNGIIYDSSDDTYIVSLRHQDAVIKVRRATGELVWILGNHFGWGPEFEPYLLTPVGTPFVWQYHQHAPMLTPEGTLLLFDNGNNRAMPFEIDPDTGEPVEPIADADNFSRAVEYLIDPATMTVRQIWESKGNAGVDLYSRFISDADWLPETGNVLITFGGISFMDHVATNGNAVRIIEVDRNTPATTLFDLSIQATDPESPGYTVYRSERIAELYSDLTVALVADKPSPAQLGTVGTVRFTATATGGSGTYDYRFLIRDPQEVWTEGQDYGNGDTFAWTPPSAGSWYIQVQARNVGSSALYEGLTDQPFDVLADPPVSSVTLDADQPNPAVQETVHFTATATGGSGSYDYQFWVRDPAGTLAVGQTYGHGNTFDWSPSEAGAWAVTVWAKNLGSTAAFEAEHTRSFAVAAADLAVTSGHVLTPSPTAPLAAVYDVTTNKISRVSFTASDGVESFEKSFPAPAKAHSLPLFGFKPGREYEVAVTLTDLEDHTLELGTLSFTTDPLPSDFPPLEVLVSQPDKMEPGYTLLWVGNRAPGARSYTMLLDHVGDVVWYQELDAGDIRQLPNGNLFYQFQGGAAEATLLGEVVRSWHPAGTTETPLPDSIEVGSPDDHPIFFHHEVFPTEHGTILTLDRVDRLVQGYPTSDTDPEAPTADTVVIDEPIVEFDMETGEILHYYSLVDMLDPRRIGFNSVAPQPPCPASNPECKADWVHDNAIIYDSSDDTYIVSLRHQDAVIKVARATGELVWILGNHWGWGPEFEPYLLTPVGTPFVWQYHQHAPMLTPEGTLLLFDNGNNRAMPFEIDPDTGQPVEPIADADNFSRAVEYLIDPATMTVRQIWESKGNAGVDLYSRFISDADWLPETGNVLITFGGISFVDHVATNGNAVRIIEVDRNTPATTLFDLSIQATDPESPGYTVYRSERIAELYSDLTVALVADKPSPAPLVTVGTVTFTASAGGGGGDYDYRFLIRDPSGVWTEGQDYGNGDSFAWTPPDVGRWAIQARARNVGSSALYDALAGRIFEVLTDLPVSSVTLAADQASPAPLATVGTVTFTASAGGGGGDYDYRFLIRDPSGVWTEGQDYGNGDSFAWTPPDVGRWAIQARARNVGSSALYDALAGRIFEVLTDPPVSSVTLVADQASPAPLVTVGTVTFTASAGGGGGDYDYRFLIRDPSGVWTEGQDYGNGDSFAWTPPDVGRWAIQARARNVGSSALYDALAGRIFEVLTDPPVSSVTLVADQASPAPLATVGTVTFTASAGGGGGDYDYRFLIRDPSGVWTEGQDYGNGDSFAWTPPYAGRWGIQVRTKNVGSTVRWDVLDGGVWVIHDQPVPILSVSFDSGAEGFTYIDDAFLATNQPAYANGSHVPDQGFSGGGLSVLLGGIDDADILHMSGGWRRTFTLETDSEVSLTLRYKLTQEPDYELNELSQVLVAVDETLVGAAPNYYVAQMVGDGEGGTPLTTGWVQMVLNLGTLAGGDHSLTIGGYNNQKTFLSETTEVLIDDIVVESTSGSPPPAPFPYRILYNNDMTNTVTLTSPFHSMGAPFTTDVLHGTVDEVAGLTDVHLLSPGLGWIPVWDSQIYPAAEHYQRWEQTTGLQADTYGQFLMAGGDILQEFIDRCRETGQVPFISFRMNDPHHQHHADDFVAGIYRLRSQWISDFYLAHLDDRLGDDYLTNFRSRGLNWMVPEVREQKYEFLREILENYDIDGVELDFLRWDGYFKTSETTEAKREAVMTAFISHIRTLLDTTAKPGQHRWLGIRVPSYFRTQGQPYMKNYSDMGIDLQAVTAAGVDFVNLSVSYPLVQQTDLAEIRLLIPDTAIFFEMTYVTWDPPARGIQLDFFRSTDEQFYTTADLAYRQGANGISLFNFQYFRGNGPNPQSDPQGPFHEPPFHIIPQLRDPEWLANIPQQWYMEGDSSWYRDVPREFYVDQPQAMMLQLYPSNSLHDADAMFRLFHEDPCSECSWEVEFNGFVLDETGCLEHPIDNRYVGNDYGDLEQYACFRVPRTLVLEGSNAIVINLNSGGPVWVRYYDLILSPDQWISN